MVSMSNERVKDVRDFIPDFCEGCRYRLAGMEDLPCRMCRPIFSEPTYFLMNSLLRRNERKKEVKP